MQYRRRTSEYVMLAVQLLILVHYRRSDWTPVGMFCQRRGLAHCSLTPTGGILPPPLSDMAATTLAALRLRLSRCLGRMQALVWEDSDRGRRPGDSEPRK
jgi:hypothetical protein